MATLSRLVEDRTDLTDDDVAHLSRIAEEWSLLSDLALSDLVLWVPTWNEGGLVAVAQVRPTTAPTAVPDDVVGAFAPRGRFPQLDQAVAFGRPVTLRDGEHPWVPGEMEAYPVRRDGRVIGVLARRASGAPRVAGQLEEIYLTSADDLFAMLVEGRFPVVETGFDTTEAPRVGDGMVRLDAAGSVSYASPNARSAFSRLGWVNELESFSLGEIAESLSNIRHDAHEEGLRSALSGRGLRRVECENSAGTIDLLVMPLLAGTDRIGAIVLLHNITEVRRRDRELVTKDATIR
ncbi:MAG: histidine kinase N-terminal domain-containing protein, partial [Actinobacteria bacterium]|nr:histidine kinase N-terminal domain-containing protein [Actinomycetota bacterium]